MDSSIVVVGALTRWALFHSMFELKAAKMNLQRILFQELMLYKYKSGHNATEASKILFVRKMKALLITVQQSDELQEPRRLGKIRWG